MSDMLELYRGDFEKIKQFEITKTYKHCLVGRGIYLTNSLRVAQSYRTKGSGQRQKDVLFNGPAENRTDALEKAFANFCKDNWEKTHHWKDRYPTSGKIKERFDASFKAIWCELCENGKIKAEYTTAPIMTLKPGRFTSSSSVRAMQKYKEAKHTRYLKVEYSQNDIGYITRFLFPETIFNANVFHVEKPIYDESFWSLVYEAGMIVGDKYDNLENFIKGNRGKTLKPHFNKFDMSPDKYNRLAELLKPYGIIGYEYDGGIHVGGCGKHRAFSIWDEEFVNQHKVDRYR